MKKRKKSTKPKRNPSFKLSAQQKRKLPKALQQAILKYHKKK